LIKLSQKMRSTPRLVEVTKKTRRNSKERGGQDYEPQGR